MEATAKATQAIEPIGPTVTEVRPCTSLKPISRCPVFDTKSLDRPFAQPSPVPRYINHALLPSWETQVRPEGAPPVWSRFAFGAPLPSTPPTTSRLATRARRHDSLELASYRIGAAMLTPSSSTSSEATIRSPAVDQDSSPRRLQDSSATEVTAWWKAPATTSIEGQEEKQVAVDGMVEVEVVMGTPIASRSETCVVRDRAPSPTRRPVNDFGARSPLDTLIDELNTRARAPAGLGLSLGCAMFEDVTLDDQDDFRLEDEDSTTWFAPILRGSPVTSTVSSSRASTASDGEVPALPDKARPMSVWWNASGLSTTNDIDSPAMISCLTPNSVSVFSSNDLYLPSTAATTPFLTPAIEPFPQLAFGVDVSICPPPNPVANNLGRFMHEPHWDDPVVEELTKSSRLRSYFRGVFRSKQFRASRFL